MRTSGISWLLLLCSGVLGTATATAQVPTGERGIDIQRFRPALDGDGFLGVQATRTPGPGRYDFGVWGNVALNPLVLRQGEDVELDVIDLSYTMDFQFQVGIGGRFALGLDFPVVVYQDVSDVSLGDGLVDIARSAPGDPRLTFRYRFLGQDSRVERERNEGHGVALQAGITAPFGDENSFASESGVTTELFALADFHVLGAGVGAQLGWRHRFDPQTVVGVRFHDELELGVALKVPIPVTQDFLAILETRFVTDAARPFLDQPTTAVEGDLGLRLRRGSVTLNLGVGTGFNGGVGTPSFRTMFGVWWTPRILDSDDDGIPDDRDDCEFLPEDFDGFEDSDGCLDPDNDNDLIPDVDDRCPDEEAEEFRDEDEDGCTDPMSDQDGDGVDDADDACPDQPEDRDGHQDEDGCADPDNDGDSVPDASDQCANEPEDADGFQDEDGCPDLDNDGDGMADDDDRCPGAAEDVDQHEDEDGCPDPDDDRDGVLDADDRCADAAETINGVDDGDGCPDRGGRAIFRATGQPDAAGYRVEGQIAFAADHTLPDAAAGAVEQLARHMTRAWPHRLRVSIAAGDAARIGALTTALRARGVPAERFEVVASDSVRGRRVVVERAPESEENAQPNGDDTGE